MIKEDLKISKDLASVVLNIPKENIVDVYIDGKYLLIKKDNNRIEEYNIYEFVFKCKEWACNKGFILISYKKPYDSVKKKGYCQTHHIHDKTREKDKPFVCNFEYEAIIKACEWILSEVSK